MNRYTAKQRAILRKLRDAAADFVFLYQRSMAFKGSFPDEASAWRLFGGTVHLDLDKAKRYRLGKLVLEKASEAEDLLDSHVSLMIGLRAHALKNGILQSDIDAAEMSGNQSAIKSSTKRVKQRIETLRTEVELEDLARVRSSRNIATAFMKAIPGSSRREAESLWRAAITLNPRLAKPSSLRESAPGKRAVRPSRRAKRH